MLKIPVYPEWNPAFQVAKHQSSDPQVHSETMEIYAPLAERMGVTRFQNELEDLSFEILQPEMRDSILGRLEFLAIETKSLIPKICQELETILSAQGVKCEVTGRRKTAYSISQKMQVKNVTMDQLSDVMAFRVIVENEANCYQTLGVIHTAFPVVMGRFKDYISTPKTNGYRSLHTGFIDYYSLNTASKATYRAAWPIHIQP